MDHIIRERYPTFVDALRDLDDALSLLFLFASLPSTTTVPPKVISRCQRLCHEFEHYLITTNSLQKSFLSIKGIYYQATIQGQDIMWLVPYRFVQRVSGDVDYRIMGTFVELYATLLGFVNFRLYTSIGLVYPPKFDVSSDDKGGELAAFTLEGHKVGAAIENEQPPLLQNGHAQISNSAEITKHIADAVTAQETEQEDRGDGSEVIPDSVGEAAGPTDSLDPFTPAVAAGDILDQPSLSESETASLFAPFTFFISREAPRHPIEFLLRAFGCKRIGWSEVLGEGAFTHIENDERITHQVSDRPETSLRSAVEGDATDANTNGQTSIQSASRMPGRIYVQPQWVWDCVNEGKLLAPALYSPGTILPPHLSPWVKPTKGQYDPRVSLAEQEEEGEAELPVEDEDKLDEQETSAQDEAGTDEAESEDEDINGGMDVAASDEDDDAEEVDETFDGFDEEPPSNELSSSEAEEDEATLYQRELEAEATGLPVSSTAPKIKSKPESSTKTDTPQPTNEAAKRRKRQQREEEAELERRKMMMSRKKRKLYEKMQYGNDKRADEARGLREKRRRIERGTARGRS